MIDDKIAYFKKLIEHERKLTMKHLNLSAHYRKCLHALLEERERVYPEQYTKYGNIRKAYKDKF